MKGQVDSVTRSKSGKAWRVKIGDKFYGAALDSKLDTMIGQAIDFDYQDGKYGLWIQSWGQDRTQPPTAAPQAAPQRQASNGDRYWLPFVSNQCAHLIAAGIIKEPADIYKWALAAYSAIRKVDSSDNPAF